MPSDDDREYCCGCDEPLEYCNCENDDDDDEGCGSLLGHSARAERRLSYCGSDVIGGRRRLGYEFECDATSHRYLDSAMEATAKSWRNARFIHAGGYMLAKEDGSVMGDHPVELVTVPCTVPEHHKVLSAAFPTGRLGSGGFRAWSNGSCGMHVHVGRRSLTPLQIGKGKVFFNHPANIAFVIDVAGRRPNGYCEAVFDSAVRQASCDPEAFDRYELYNMANPKTIELRIFRPSPRISSILKNLEFVESVFEFVKQAPICSSTLLNVGALSYLHYMKWLSADANRKSYAWMHGWLMARAGMYGDSYRKFLRKNVKEDRNGNPKPGSPELGDN